MIRVIIRKDLQSYLGSNIQSEHIKHYVTKYQFYQQLPQQYATGNHSTNTSALLLFNIASPTQRTCVINIIWKMVKIMKLLNNSL